MLLFRCGNEYRQNSDTDNRLKGFLVRINIKVLGTLKFAFIVVFTIRSQRSIGQTFAKINWTSQ